MKVLNADTVRRAEEELRESEQFLQNMFDAIQDGISVLDADLNVIRTNRWMEQMYAHQMPLVGRKCYQAYQQRRSPCPWCPTLSTIKTGEAHAEIVPYPSAQDPTGWIELSAFPIKDEQGQVTNVIEHVKDITARVQAEEALHRALEETARSQQLLLALSQAAQAVQRARTPEAVYQAIGEQAAGLDIDITVFTLSDDRTHLIVSHLTLGSDLVRAGEKLTGLSAEGYRFPLTPGGFFDRIVAGGETVFSHLDATPFAEALPRPVRPLAGRLAQLFGWQQSIIAPLAIGSEVGGLLVVTGTDLTESDVPAITAFANQAAVAIENARLLHETQRRNRELTLLNRVIAATAAAGESPEAESRSRSGAESRSRSGAESRSRSGEGPRALEPILEVVCREMALAFEVPQAAVTLFNKEKTEAVVVAEYLSPGSGQRLAPGRPPSLGERIPVADNPAFQHLLTRKTPMVIGDAPGTASGLGPGMASGLGDLMRRRGTVSLLLLPLMVDGEVVGSLGVDAIEPRSFSAEEVNLAWRVAEQVSGVLARAQLREERWMMEEQFQQAQKMEAVGRLAGGVAHDFNNLLTVIHLSTQLLERKLHPQDPLWVHVQGIRDAGRRATGLTRQLLAFSRREIVEPQVLNLNRLLGELDRMLRRLISEEIELTTRLADDLWPIQIDPTQLEQVVVNLAVNACDAMPGGGKLTLETANAVLDAAYAAHHLEVEPGEYVLLAVSDNGVGMSDEVKAHLFEPFFTTKEKGKGSGLGLATVFGIVKQNRGHIGVYSEEGQGTTFKIYLPRVAGGAPALARQPQAAARRARGETLLVVEDETLVRKLTQDILAAQGYQVLTAKDGMEALQIAERHQGPIHLLLTDVVMPHLSGRALADQLKPSRPEMRVLYTSGYTDNAIVHHGVLDEGVHFLSKPFDLETLARKVRDLLDDKV